MSSLPRYSVEAEATPNNSGILGYRVRDTHHDSAGLLDNSNFLIRHVDRESALQTSKRLNSHWTEIQTVRALLPHEGDYCGPF